MKTLQMFNSEYGLMLFPWGSFGGMEWWYWTRRAVTILTPYIITHTQTYVTLHIIRTTQLYKIIRIITIYICIRYTSRET